MPNGKVDPESLIASIYDCALDSSGWQRTGDDLRRLLQADTFVATHQAPAQPEAALIGSNLDLRCLQEYAQGWWKHDVWTQGALTQPLGRAYIMSEIVRDEDWVQTDFYNVLVKPYSGQRYCVGTLLDVDDGLGVLGFHRPHAAPDFGDMERRMLQRMAPHIRQSLRISGRLSREQDSQRLAQAAIDTLSFGLIVVDSDCRPRLMNGMAERCLVPGHGFIGGRANQVLRTASTVETQVLHRLVHRATTPGLASPGSMLLHRTVPEVPLMLLVSPLIGRQATLFPIGEPAALILVHGIEDALPTEGSLRDLFGLSATEAMLAVRLAGGTRLEDVAIERGVKISTLRTHVSAILQKTGTARQAELVRVLTRLAIHRADLG